MLRRDFIRNTGTLALAGSVATPFMTFDKQPAKNKLFGVLNSNRSDVAYEDWHGHKLDRKLLTLTQKY